MKDGIIVDTQDRCMWNVKSGQVIPYSVQWIPEALIMEDERLEDGQIVRIIDARQRYFCYAQCCCTEQAARLCKHNSWDYQTPVQDPNAKIPTEAICKRTLQENKVIHKYL